MKRIYDKSFRYTKAAETTPEYLRAKFRKILRELEQQPKPPIPIGLNKRRM
jgi:hypothetical protein